VKVSARDLGTGRQQQITVSSNANMSEADIQRAIHEAQEYEATDGQRKAAIDSIGEAEKVLARANNAYNKVHKTLDKSVKKQVKSDMNHLQRLIAKANPSKLTQEQADEITRAKEALEASAAPVIAQADAAGDGEHK
ncbi:MAG: Hsp70 family protein, partial [Lachnospiraceae bacterium]|nr:Hsp70 family protein [Lachnospiraceae bacterium]